MGLLLDRGAMHSAAPTYPAADWPAVLRERRWSVHFEAGGAEWRDMLHNAGRLREVLEAGGQHLRIDAASTQWRRLLLDRGAMHSAAPTYPAADWPAVLRERRWPVHFEAGGAEWRDMLHNAGRLRAVLAEGGGHVCPDAASTQWRRLLLDPRHLQAAVFRLKSEGKRHPRSPGGCAATPQAVVDLNVVTNVVTRRCDVGLLRDSSSAWLGRSAL